jgi:hypothetical protein
MYIMLNTINIGIVSLSPDSCLICQMTPINRPYGQYDSDLPLLYSPRMRRATLFVLTFACISLIAVQVSGLHLHAEAGGHDDAGSHEPHLQQAFSHDKDHGGAHLDISVFEPASVSSQVDVFIPNSAVSATATLPKWEYRWPISASRIPLRRYSRWRPPLRAPPFPV